MVIHISAFLRKTGGKLFGSRIEFRVRLFNILASAGVCIGFVFTVFDIINNTGAINVVTSAVSMIISMALLYYSSRSGRYQFCYMVTIIVIFLGIFPLFFFLAGAYYGSMPGFFIFAVVFTILMLEGKKALVMVVIELTLYISLFLISYHYPQTIKWYTTNLEMLLDTMISFVVISVSLGITMFLHLRLYNRQNRELEAARKQAEEFAEMKSELFAGMSHEMRTPLTVMSAYAQFAVEQIRNEGANEQTLADLASISDEAKRLAEMADGTLKILMSTSESNETVRRKASLVNLGDVSGRLARLLEPIASRKGRKLTAHIKDNIPDILGNADELTQLLWNILQNALTHSGGNTELSAEAYGGSVIVTVKDDGGGIDASLLPRIFERGVSGKKGGTGIGLSICRDIAMRHGGDIRAESETGKGTCITVTLNGMTGGSDD